MKSANKYTVKIFGDSYHLLSDELEEHVVSSVDLTDSLMTEIANSSGIADVKKLAVLAALQLASRIITLESTVKQDHKRAKDLEKLLDDELN